MFMSYQSEYKGRSANITTEIAKRQKRSKRFHFVFFVILRILELIGVYLANGQKTTVSESEVRASGRCGSDRGTKPEEQIL
jgi:hypothetical protein